MTTISHTHLAPNYPSSCHTQHHMNINNKKCTLSTYINTYNIIIIHTYTQNTTLIHNISCLFFLYLPILLSTFHIVKLTLLLKCLIHALPHYKPKNPLFLLILFQFLFQFFLLVFIQRTTKRLKSTFAAHSSPPPPPPQSSAPPLPPAPH